MKIKQKKYMFNGVFICDNDTFAFFDIFLPGFYGSHKVNLQNFYVNELTK